MTTTWEQYWQKKADALRDRAHHLSREGYPELAEQYQEEAEDITQAFLADAVITTDSGVAVKQPPEPNWDGLEELERRWLHGDR